MNLETIEFFFFAFRKIKTLQICSSLSRKQSASSTHGVFLEVSEVINHTTNSIKQSVPYAMVMKSGIVGLRTRRCDQEERGSCAEFTK